MVGTSKAYKIISYVVMTLWAAIIILPFLLLLMSSLTDLADLITNGLQVRSVNIGGMHFKEGAQKLADHVFLDKKDKQLLKLVRDLGIAVETRAVPNDVSFSISEVLRDA